MDNPKLIINSKEEYQLEADLTTIGRASENDICITDDKNISRYHVEIEKRDGEFWLIDLGSFNGTTLNGEQVESEKPLFEGDEIILGGSTKIDFVISPAEENEEKEKQTDDADAPPAVEKKSYKMILLLTIAGLAVGLAIIFVFVAGFLFFNKSNGSTACNASAKITNFEDGDVVSQSTQLEVELENGDCAAKASFTIDGEEFAKVESQPFTATIDPSQMAQFSDGQTHQIQIILEDNQGNKIPPSASVAVVLRTIETKTPTPTPTGTGGEDPPPPPPPTSGRTVSLIDVNNMSKKILPQFSGSFKYQTNNKFFLQEVQKKTAEYVAEGYFERAEQYRDNIDTQFIQERNLDPPLGYILAMSRSKFLPSNDSNGAGLWRMSNELVVTSGYAGLCGTETIAAPSQKCAAIASSEYLKDLILRVFEGDVIYGIAAFGMSSEEAAAWKDTLPADRSDFWNVIKSPQQREEIVRFFAAAMVAENPQKFGLKNDRPISELYKIYMQ